MTDLTVYVLKPKSIGLTPGEYSLSDLFDITTETVSVTASSSPTYLYTEALILPGPPDAVVAAGVNPVDGTIHVNVDPSSLSAVKVDLTESVTASTPFDTTASVKLSTEIEWFQSQVTFAKFVDPFPPIMTEIHFEHAGVFGSQKPVTEGQDAVFIVELNYNPTSAVTVQYTTTDGTAHAGTDYVAKSGFLTFLPGQSLIQMVDVTTLVNPNASPGASFQLSLTDASGATILPQYMARSATLTSSLFTPGDDSVDFTSLTPDQVAVLNLGTSFYQALGGNDTVVLPSTLDPSTGRYVISGSGGSAPNAEWDPTKTFTVGAASDTTANQDKIFEGAGTYNLSIVGSAIVGVAFDGIDTSISSISLGSGENDILQIGAGKTLITGGSPTTLLYVESDGKVGVNLNSVTADEIDIYNTPAATTTGQVLTNSLFVEADSSTGSGLGTDPVKGGNLIVRDSVTLSDGVIGTGPNGSLDVGGGQSAAANTIHVEASGSIVGNGSIANFQGISVGNDGLPQIVDGQVIDDGLIEAWGGTLAVAGNVTGTGTLQIDANSTLVLFDSDSTKVSFAGANGTLAVFGTSMPTGVIGGLKLGDTIDLTTIPYVSGAQAVLGPGNILQVSDGGSTYSLQLSGNFNGVTFEVNIDKTVGTAITIVPPPIVAIQATNTIVHEGLTDPQDIGFEITRSGDSSSSITLNYAVTGLASDDYNFKDPLVGTITIPAGQTTTSLVLHIDAPDDMPRPTEDLQLGIFPSSTSPNIQISNQIANVQIESDNGPYTTDHLVQWAEQHAAQQWLAGNPGVDVTINDLASISAYARDLLTGERKIPGRSTDTIIRDAQYFFHGLTAELQGDPVYYVGVLEVLPVYNVLKSVFNNPSWLQTDPLNPTSPPGGTAEAYDGLVEGTSIYWGSVFGEIDLTGLVKSWANGTAPPPPQPTTLGTDGDGYIAGATVFADTRGNGTFDYGEPFGFTDPNGNFAIEDASAPLIAFGGTDTSTGLLFKGQLSAPAGSTDITPLTTLLSDLQSDPSAQQHVLSSLGLSSNLNLTTFDPIAAAQGGSPDGAATQVAGAKVYDTVEMIASALVGAGGTFSQSLHAAFSALASALDGTGINLGDKTALSALITQVAQTESVTLGHGVADTIASVIAAGNAALDHILQTDQPGSQLLSDVASIERVEQGVASTEITNAGGSLAQLQAAANLFAGTNLSELVSQGLAAAPGTISDTEGAAINTTVATFVDGNPNAAPSDFSATINWGDGTTTPGTVEAQNGGGFAVTGAHTYGEEGNYQTAVTINDVGGSTTTAVSTATIADAPLTATASSINGIEGAAINATVATFVDGNPNAALSDFSATINWGDGTTTTGMIVAQNGGGFAVTGPHTYADEGIYQATVTVNDVGGSTATATSAAAIADAPVTATPASNSGTEGAVINATVATFVDGNPNAVVSDFSATINWGDGTTSVGTIVAQDGGGFAVAGAYTYAEEGNYQVGVIINDIGGSTTTTTSNAAIADAPITATPGSISGTEGAAINTAVATFTDGNPNAVVSNFSTIINWGDGTTTPGTVVAQNGGGFAVTGTHSYVEEGNYQAAVAIADAGGSTATATSTATIADAPIVATPASISGTEGTATNATVATFTDGNPNAVVSDFSTTINWGDGTTLIGTVVMQNGGGFAVTGTHSYAEEGNYQAAVAIADVGGSTATATSTATIADAPIVATPASISGTEGTAINATVATFTDGNPNAVVSDFSATINWDDGTTSIGTVVAQNGGGFVITGPHTYVDEGNYQVGVTINDVGGSTASASETAQVADADVLSGQSLNFAAAVKQALNNVAVAKFTDAYAGSTPGDFTSTINWGDGTTSTGVVSGGNGLFTASGSHTYAAAGHDNVTVTLSEMAPGSAVGTAISTVNVSGVQAQPPQIISDGGGDTASVIITDDTKFVDVVHATDPNPNTSMTYSIVGGANQKLFTIDPKSGDLSFKSEPVDGKTYQVKVAASNGTQQDVQTINVKVGDGNLESGNPGVADTFVFKPHFGLEIVNGFDAQSSNHDVIELDHSLFKGATAGESGNASLKLIADHSLQLGHDLFIFTDTHDVIDLKATNIHSLTSHDFIIT